MKNLKYLLIALCFFCLCDSFAQTAPTRGAYGTQTNYTTTSMHIVTPAGVAKSADTLSNGDTGILFIWMGQGYASSFDVLSSTLTGTVATTSNILYGYNNGGRKLTAAQAATIGSAGTGFAITGNTTYCAGCVGASSTTVPGASKHYIWQVPNNAGALFDNYIIRVIQTGTTTATYTGNIQSQY